VPSLFAAWTCYVSLAILAVGVAAQAPPAPRRQPLRAVPPGMPLHLAIRTLADASRTRIGFESIDTVESGAQLVDLAAPLPMGDSEPQLVLAALLGKKGQYTWFESDGVLVVRPADADRGSRSHRGGHRLGSASVPA
jgi:hypothetical protein